MLENILYQKSGYFLVWHGRAGSAIPVWSVIWNIHIIPFRCFDPINFISTYSLER